MQSFHYIVLILLRQLKIIFEGVTKDTFVTSMGRWIQHGDEWYKVSLETSKTWSLQEFNTGSNIVQHLY